jgi:Zn-dependent M28 family amino/carboxypeptidase
VPEGPGLNDNGSGVAALLEMARRLAAARRGADTLRLGFWTAEEWGLYGSKHYVRTLPPPERRRIQAYVNLDMVGSPNAVTEVYSSRNAATTALRKGLPGVGTTPVAAASDHLPFRDRGIAVSGVYTGSTETKSRAQARRLGGRAGRPRDRCYHRVCDDVDNVDTKLAARIATAAARALAELARR